MESGKSRLLGGPREVPRDTGYVNNQHKGHYHDYDYGELRTGHPQEHPKTTHWGSRSQGDVVSDIEGETWTSHSRVVV